MWEHWIKCLYWNSAMLHPLVISLCFSNEYVKIWMKTYRVYRVAPGFSQVVYMSGSTIFGLCLHKLSTIERIFFCKSLSAALSSWIKYLSENTSLFWEEYLPILSTFQRTLKYFSEDQVEKNSYSHLETSLPSSL